MVQYKPGMVICGLTHGWLAFVDYEHKLSLCHRQVVHDSAINSIQLYENKIITCSDDQSIAIHVWDKASFVKVNRVCNAHYSSIRCSIIVGKYLITSSYDQSLSIWMIKDDCAVLVKSCKHPIPDVSSLCITEKDSYMSVIIVGMGMCAMGIYGLQL